MENEDLGMMYVGASYQKTGSHQLKRRSDEAAVGFQSGGGKRQVRFAEQ
jgi:hypothetical protein